MYAAVTAEPGPESGLGKSVIALDRARHRAVHDLAEKEQNESLEEKQQQDYQKFIIFLTLKINEYCRQIRTEAGEAAVSDLPCPEIVETQADDPAGSVQTRDEQVAELESLLAESLGQFDSELLKEEERLASRQPRDRETGYGYGGSQETGSGEQAAGTGSSGGTGQASGQGAGGSQSAGTGGSAGSTDRDSQGGQPAGTGFPGTTAGSESGKGEGGAAGTDGSEGAGEGAGETGKDDEQLTGSSESKPGKEDLDTGDDDVVARQLREAAEKETDPELKEKLWEEYRKYKEGVR